ncbi:MAG: hypothetical protein H0X18_11705 [Geodermatophilaceae bacterium]|nr:hypothetical protein [Geodermatophilaceae bacterium]
MHHPVNEQLTLFDDEAADLEIADLEGLLVAGAALVQRGAEARLSIVLGEQWRASLMMEAFDQRGLPGEQVRTFDGQFSVRTPFHRSVLPLAARWSRGSSKLLPPGWELTPARVRLWALASGRADPSGYLLGLGRTDEASCWSAAGTALAAAGLAGALLGPRAGGPAYRIVGQRRTRRLGALLGAAPVGAPPGAWPLQPPG